MNNIQKLNDLLSHMPSIYPHMLSTVCFDSIALKLTDDEINAYTDIYGRKHIYQYFMDIAYTVAKRSTCIKRQVGAVIVKNMKIVSQGYNGVSHNRKNCTAESCRFLANGKCAIYPLHAENNAIMFATPEERAGATMFITCQACSNCASMISNSGIIRVIYDVPHTPQYDILKEAGIEELQIIDAIRKDLYNKESKYYKTSY